MNNLELAKKLNESVTGVLTSKDMEGFERAYQIAEAAGKLSEMLTPEYMKPIMALQGNKLGFKTDKDNAKGYPMEVVKNCLIEAVLTGVQPFGNQFNIIANNCYITKEGFGYLLKNLPGLSYNIIPALPRINSDKSSAAIDMKITWTLNGIKTEETIPIPVKMNAYMGTDAVIGKATRKARAWLYNTITGSEVADGDVIDIKADVVQTEPLKEVAAKKEEQRIIDFITESKTVNHLETAKAYLTTDYLKDLYETKMEELKNAE